jgi:TolB-like protein
MRRTGGNLLKAWLGLAMLAAPALAQDQRPGVAVLPFENGGSYGRDREDFEALRKGLAAMLISELGAKADLRLVDRFETQRVLDEQGLAVAERVDRETAARVGKLVGARYMVTGSFIDLYGDFRVDARIIDVETGEILKVVRNDPRLHDRKDMFRILQSVADRIVADTKLPPLPAASARVTRQVPTEALAFFSRALLYQDRGDRAKAVEYYEKALEVFPEYAEASEGLRKARGR